MCSSHEHAYYHANNNIQLWYTMEAPLPAKSTSYTSHASQAGTTTLRHLLGLPFKQTEIASDAAHLRSLPPPMYRTGNKLFLSASLWIILYRRYKKKVQLSQWKQSKPGIKSLISVKAHCNKVHISLFSNNILDIT